MTNIDSRTSMHRTPLHLASIRGHVEVVRLLTNEGADVDAEDVDKNTPLHYASMYGHTEVVQKLLKRGACVLAKNLLNKTSLDIASNVKIVEEIREFCENRGILLDFSQYSRTPFNGVVLRNSREDEISRLIAKCAAVPNPNQVKKL